MSDSDAVAGFVMLIFVSPILLLLAAAIAAALGWKPEPMPIRVKKLHPMARLPVHGNDFAAGLDLFTIDQLFVQPGETLAMRTGIAAEIPEYHVGLIRPRSSAFRKGLVIQGTIDSDYRGEIMVVVTNVSKGPVLIDNGKAVAQMILVPYIRRKAQEVDELDSTERGTQGFGSTGNAL